MKKNSIYTLIVIGLIVTFFILGLYSISSSKGTVIGLQVGNHFRYGFAINYSGTNYTTSTATGELYVRVNAIDSHLNLVQVNLTNTLSGPLRQVMLSQIDPPTPSRNLNQSFYYRGRATGIHGENFGIQGEYFGWIHATISVGEKVGAWTVVGETTQNIGAGSFATYDLVQTTLNVTKGVEYITVTHLYYEQLTGVLVHLTYENIVRAQTNHSKIFYQESELMDLTAASYNFPLLSKLMPFLILINPVLNMLSTYGFLILLAVVVILVIVLAKKQLVKRI